MDNNDFVFDKASVLKAVKAIEDNIQNEEFTPAKSDDKPRDKQNEKQTTNKETPKENMLGKFKNPEELLKAYRELEREFTKKSQRLKELESSLRPYESEEEWREAADKFFEKTPSAKALAREMACEIALDPTLKEGRDCFDKALVRALAKCFKTPEQLMSDGQFLEKYVFGSDEIRRVVIDRYLKSLDEKMPPIIFAGGGIQLAAEPFRPRTVKEAGSMFLRENK